MKIVVQSNIKIEFPLVPTDFQELLGDSKNIWNWLDSYLQKFNERNYLERRGLSLRDYKIYGVCMGEVTQRWGAYNNPYLSKEDRRLARVYYNQIAQIFGYNYWSSGDKKRLPSDIDSKLGINMWLWIENRIRLSAEQYHTKENLIPDLFLAELLRIWTYHRTKDYWRLAQQQYDVICKHIEDYGDLYYVIRDAPQELDLINISNAREVEADAAEFYLPLPPAETLDARYFTIEEDQVTDGILPSIDYIQELAANLVFLPRPPAYLFDISPSIKRNKKRT